jgi:lipoate-protein ligase A
MAVDEVLMEGARSGQVTLRLYGWAPGCLSFGRNQRARGRYDSERAAARRIDVVRRPTGGRSVFHFREITYSVTAPAGEWGGLQEAYARINRALAGALRDLGVPASVASRERAGRAPRPTARACFRDPLPGEVTAGGRKLVGSAQWRDRGALLQHGSLLLHNDQSVVEDLRIGPSAREPVPAAALAEFLDPLPEPAEVSEALRRAFEEEFGRALDWDELTPAETAAAAETRAAYQDPKWTWRR